MLSLSLSLMVYAFPSRSSHPNLVLYTLAIILSDSWLDFQIPFGIRFYTSLVRKDRQRLHYNYSLSLSLPPIPLTHSLQTTMPFESLRKINKLWSGTVRWNSRCTPYTEKGVDRDSLTDNNCRIGRNKRNFYMPLKSIIKKILIKELYENSVDWLTFNWLKHWLYKIHCNSFQRFVLWLLSKQ